MAGVPDLLAADGGRAAEAPPRARAASSFLGALDDELADELRQRGEHVEDEAAAGGGGVDRLLQGAEPDAGLRRSSHDRDQVLQRAAEAGPGGSRPRCRRGAGSPGLGQFRAVGGLPDLSENTPAGSRRRSAGAAAGPAAGPCRDAGVPDQRAGKGGRSAASRSPGSVRRAGSRAGGGRHAISVRKRVVAGLLDTPTLRHVFSTLRAGRSGLLPAGSRVGRTDAGGVEKRNVLQHPARGVRRR